MTNDKRDPQGMATSRAAAVYHVVIACPNTGRSIRTGIDLLDLDAFVFIALQPQEITCCHCPERHRWTQRDAWIECGNTPAPRTA
ncbi:MAG: hypothetical protein AB7G23_20840 [Vicinamibacterales bacterium]